MTKQRHSDEDVKFWAEVFTELNITLKEIETQLGISHSTVWWGFMHRLLHIDYDLYEKTMRLLNYHVHNHNSKKIVQ